MIEFHCPHCRKKLKAPFGTEGRWSKCKCGSAVMVLLPAVAEEIPVATLLNEDPPYRPCFSREC